MSEEMEAAMVAEEALQRAVADVIESQCYEDGNDNWNGLAADAVASAVIPLVREAVAAEIEAVAAEIEAKLKTYPYSAYAVRLIKSCATIARSGSGGSSD